MRTSTDDRQKRLASFANRVQQLSAAREVLINQLAHHEAILGRARAEYHGLLNEGAAISMLPDDILAMIFEQAHDSQRKTSRVEIQISRVCKRWRDLTLCLPMLWAKIQREQEQVHFGPIDAYLRRSQESPISLEIHISYYEDSQDLATFYRLITPHMPRCRNLYFLCPYTSYSCWAQFVEILRGVQLSLLSHVWLCHLGDNVAETTVAEASPSLTAIHLTDTAIRACPFPLEFVTHLRIDGDILPSAIDVREGLTHMPCLTHLELQDIYGTGAQWAHGLDVQLPCLRVLSIEALNNAFAGSYILLVLQVLQMPLLETLSLRGYAEPFDVHDTDPFAESPQIFPSLHHLILRNSPVPVRHLAFIFPSVIELTYVGDRLDSLDSLKAVLCLRVLQNTLPTDTHAIAFWPRLATVTLPHTNAVAMDGMRNVFIQRSEAGYPLERLLLRHIPVDFEMCGCAHVGICAQWRDRTHYFE